MSTLRREARLRRRDASRRSLWALALVVLMHAPSLARAHHVLPTHLELSLHSGRVDATMHLPTNELGLALATTWGDRSLESLAITPTRFDEAFAERLRTYVATYLALEDERSVAWPIEVGAPRWVEEPELPQVLVDVSFRAPDDHVAQTLTLRDEVISQEVVTHRTLVTLAHDFERAHFEGEETLGLLRFGRRAITLDRRDANAWRGFVGMVELGAHHVAEGLDHLLFVFVLLLAAPSHAKRGRWTAARPVRDTLRRLLGVVTAFTIGHALTLALGASGLLVLPSAPVEVVVGLSVALGAVHAMRPLFAGREPIVAALFGLAHGLAFAGTLEGFGLRDESLVLALFGFHVGIEVVQLAVVVAFVPLLALGARHVSFGVVRTLGGGLALAASLVWGAERLGLPTPASALLEEATRHVPTLGALVYVALGFQVSIATWPRRRVEAVA
ncbi:MAG: HupE/UreJ family protein [Polyangiales bacterium]|nr:HupE/UreJ family protein [Myxococcales bacterium]MCB9622221.1 HupE/UreJ family protein [Sandaracinus sp.]